jgi:hypothetical protein
MGAEPLNTLLRSGGVEKTRFCLRFIAVYSYESYEQLWEISWPLHKGVFSMGYKQPNTVVAPKSRWELGDILCNTGQGGWSLAEGQWDEDPTLGIRWNGDDDTGNSGNPQSHGNPTWFILPEELHDSAREIASVWTETKELVEIKFNRPPEFDYGVFRVTISLHGIFRVPVAGMDQIFKIPTLPKRIFRYDDMQYVVARTSSDQPWLGRFVNGEWKAILQTNGCEENENPTSRAFVEDMLKAEVVKALAPWKMR